MGNYEILFEELINHNFCKFFLDGQIKKLEYKSSKAYLKYVLFNFEKHSVQYWFRICEHQENSKTDYPSQDFYKDIDPMQFFPVSLDENCDFRNSPYGMMLDLGVNTIKKYVKTLIKYHGEEGINWQETPDEYITKEKDNLQFDANHFNKRTYALFLYFIENYNKEGKIKYVNIFNFMKKSIDKSRYVFVFTQKTYKSFILLNYNVEIKKFRVAEFLYEETEKGVLNSLAQQFDVK